MSTSARISPGLAANTWSSSAIACGGCPATRSISCQCPDQVRLTAARVQSFRQQLCAPASILPFRASASAQRSCRAILAGSLAAAAVYIEIARSLSPDGVGGFSHLQSRFGRQCGPALGIDRRAGHQSTARSDGQTEQRSREQAHDRRSFRGATGSGPDWQSLLLRLGGDDIDRRCIQRPAADSAFQRAPAPPAAPPRRQRSRPAPCLRPGHAGWRP